MLAAVALLPALIAAGILVAVRFGHPNPVFQLVELDWAWTLLRLAGALSLVWLLAAAINWQIREAVRYRA